MKVSKKDKHNIEESKQSSEQGQADHELFLEAFEKPTQIYRFLRARHLISPIFLHRNLTYMNKRSNRKKNTRDSFKVDSILQKVKKSVDETSQNQPNGMKLKITGLFKSDAEEKSAELEAFITKTCNRKRKVSNVDITSSSVDEVSIGKTIIPCNPDNGKVQPVSFPLNSSYFGGNTDMSPGQGYTLHMRVRCPQGEGLKHQTQALHEPNPPKRRKSRSSVITEDVHLVHPNICADEDKKTSDQKIYGAHLVVFDQKKHCQLTEGDYELVLADLQQDATDLSQHKPSAWHAVTGGKTVDQSAVFKICPTLKFNLSWQHPPAANALIESCKKETSSKDTNSEQHTHKTRIFYQFMYSNSSCQQTEARDDSTCPWCLISCHSLYSLVKHLRSCHPRFLFTYSEHPKGARIDVSINEHYDGSYSGHPHDVYSYLGYAFSRRGPVQRMPATQILVCQPHKVVPDLTEFEDTNTCEEHNPRPMVAGHNRLYFHNLTCSLQWPSEIDIDSDGALDPQWLRQKTQNLIDDFTDVNEGEKEIMKMWNLHVMHHNFLGDCQLPRACAEFVQEYGPQVVRANLIGNFILHLVNLYDFGLIRPELIYRTMIQLYRLKHQLELTKTNFEQLSRTDMMDIDCDEEVANTVGS